jgi:hypothetical protein
LRRDALVFLGSLVAHVLFFYAVLSQFHFYPTPPENPQAVEVEIVPQPEPPVPPPVIIPHIKETIAPTKQPPSPPPTPQPQPQPKNTPQQTPERATPTPAVTPTAPTPAKVAPTPSPTPKPALAPTPLAPAPAPQPGPPKTIPRSLLLPSQTQTAIQAPKIVLHRNKEQASPLAPSVNIPGAVFAPPTPQASGAPSSPPGGAAGAKGGGLPGGALPGFGSGLRGGLLGCANADALHFTAAERARCAQAFGEGAKETPVMDAIDSSKRQVLNGEAAADAAAQKYRDSTPAGTESTPVPGQPRIGHAPGQQ